MVNNFESKGEVKQSKAVTASPSFYREINNG